MALERGAHVNAFQEPSFPLVAVLRTLALAPAFLGAASPALGAPACCGATCFRHAGGTRLVGGLAAALGDPAPGRLWRPVPLAALGGIGAGLRLRRRLASAPLVAFRRVASFPRAALRPGWGAVLNAIVAALHLRRCVGDRSGVWRGIVLPASRRWLAAAARVHDEGAGR